MIYLFILIIFQDCMRWLKMLSSPFRSSTEDQGEENKQKKKVCKNKKLVMKLQLSTILMVFQLEREEMILGVTLESLYVKQF